ncbi:MAG: alpha-glucan family phosphorylase [Dehalococcoidia bacterium]
MDNVTPKLELPHSLSGLNELAYNLWWSWHSDARQLFRELDYQIWNLSSHNPVKQLQQMKYYRKEAAAKDLKYTDLYDSVMERFHADMESEKKWFAQKYPEQANRPIAFFSAEFAIHNALPIYAGGLGVLAGDICKEASDLGIPLVGVGFMYPSGYFSQRISVDGWQEEDHRQLNFREAPIRAVNDSEGRPLRASVQLGDRQVSIAVWHVGVGSVDLYLLDTDVEENTPSDRSLASQLYVSDWEWRIQQEIVLGIGGVRVLRLLGKEPVLWHINEGHTSFMIAERIREEVERGMPFDEAVRKIRASTIFTTHTPVPAGHDVFPVYLVDKYLNNYWGLSGIDRDKILELGREETTGDRAFNMTAFAIRMSQSTNGVSKLHGGVARKMWLDLWPDLSEDQAPISSVTNGVHIPTWLSPEMGELFDMYFAEDWAQRQDDPDMWQDVWKIPNREFWETRLDLKRKLMGAMRARAQKRWAIGGAEAQQLLSMGTLFHPEVLTIGFVRRFATYKRPDLLFRDVERLMCMVTDPWRPIQIIFAGKSHPADTNAKQLLQSVYKLATDRRFHGRIAFVEDYDMHIAHYLVQGVDIWLNVPRRLKEASGTSGMKAAINGTLNLSVRDGWWEEGYNGRNGWAVDGGPERAYSEDEDNADAESIYRLLEEEIIPLFYARDRTMLPHKWIEKSKESICSITPQFSARRMMKEYVDNIYIPVIKAQSGA